MGRVAENLRHVRERIALFERKYARERHSVQLIAVSKSQGPERLAEALAAGQRDFGENYLQEALDKQEALRALAPARAGEIRWHFIGPVQSNKTRTIAERFDWVHSVDRLKVARRLGEQRPAARGPLNVLLQLNLSGEASKSGAAPEQAELLAREVAACPGLRLRGLMAIPAAESDFERQRAVFRRLADIGARLRDAGLDDCRELSMGMSADYEAAIAEGATMIRIGTDIFGRRG